VHIKKERIIERMKVDKRGYAYLGKEFSNSEFDIKVQEDGNTIFLEKVVRIPARNAWFYSPVWQKGEKRAQKDINEGNVQEFDSIESYAEDVLNAKKKIKGRRAKKLQK
jgi:hypothetical protein